MGFALSPGIEIIRVSDDRGSAVVGEGVVNTLLPSNEEKLNEILETLYRSGAMNIYYEFRVKSYSRRGAIQRARGHARARNPFSPYFIEPVSTSKREEGGTGQPDTWDVTIQVKK